MRGAFTFRLHGECRKLVHHEGRKMEYTTGGRLENSPIILATKVAFALSLKWKSALVCLALLLLAGIGYYVYSVIWFVQEIQPPGPTETLGNNTTEEKPVIPEWSGEERVNILVLGVDSRKMRPGEMPRSDTMMVVSIDPKSKTYDLFSILRDTYIHVPGHGETRINAALGYGGPELSMETVQEFTGLPIHFYVKTDFEGFKSLVDAVGGVDLEVEKNMRYRDPADKGKYDINLKKGFQHLDGNKALQYVRFRHDATSDYSRTERQRKLLAALAEKMKRTSTLIQLPGILEKLAPYVETNMQFMDMVRLSALGLKLQQAKNGTHQLPPPGAFVESRKAGSVLVPNLEKVQSYIKDALSDDGPNPSP